MEPESLSPGNLEALTGKKSLPNMKIKTIIIINYKVSKIFGKLRK